MITSFDHNAAAPLRDCARDAWLRASVENWANPSAPYPSAARAKNALEDARTRLAGLLGCRPERIVFTSGATESNNAVMNRFAASHALCAISPSEHPSVAAAARNAFGERLHLLPAAPAGRVDIANAAEWIYAHRPALVCIAAAGSETGILQPWEDLSGICREAGTAFACDGTQWLGRLPAGGLAPRCGYVTFGAHKVGGPRGVGILVLPAEDNGLHLQRGGPQEGNRRAGTENVPGVVASVAAIAQACAEVADGRAAKQEAFRNGFDAKMTALGAEIAGRNAPRLPQTSLLLMPRHAGIRWSLRLAKLGFEVGTGSACGTSRSGASPVLTAMGIDADRALRAIRVSACAATTEDDWKRLADAFAVALRELDAEESDSNVVKLD